MGHSFHFLQRLERTDDIHLKRAMELYHSPKLVLCILDQLSVSDKHQRIGLSLDPEDEGPFLVLSSKGDFITCLGKGMTTGTLYIINFERYELFRERSLEMIENASICVQDPAHFVGTITDGDLMFEQEAFRRLASLHPVFHFQFTTQFLLMDIELRKFRKKTLHNKPSNKQRAHREKMSWYWQTHMSMAHYGLLATLEGEAPIIKLYEQINIDKSEHVSSVYSLLKSLFISGEFTLMLRALWSAGRIGKFLWPHLKQILRSDDKLDMEWRFAYYASLTIGARNSTLRKEIGKYTFKSKKISHAQMHKLMNEFGSDEAFEVWFNSAAMCLLAPDELFKESSIFIKKEADEIINFPELQHLREKLPLTQCFALVGNYLGNALDDPQVWHMLLLFIPWLAKINAYELYLPEEIAKEFRATREEEIKQGFRLFDLHRQYRLRFKTQRHRNPRPGPNEKCHCGSDKKYKKCCMRKEKHTMT